MVVFINKLVLTGSAAELEAAYAEVAEFMLSRPGLIRFRFLRSDDHPEVYFNVAEWEDREALDTALKDPEFHARVSKVLPLIKGDPHIAEVVHHGAPARV
ncbi:antibiotic biosynthesis monooxygenase [Streptomyces sp. I05A-00742]|uniref:antibiotic biosynthesis monooxygenase family protein n=1 Tax=Streptomyces sp. I05A-00742 TaxID=2732853 RepID=UPI001488C32E|nr:antibiotic biosynthesis monooxygenase family protein [Streptomyces sp. I05A-00742]